MRTFTPALLAILAMALPAAPLHANPIVGGAAMSDTRDIVDNAADSKDHTTLVAAVKAAGLVSTLKRPGPFTVFAPTNAAFARLPAGRLDALVTPENKAELYGLLTYHVVSGLKTSADLQAAIKAGGGKATLTTVEGEELTATMTAKHIVLTDALGGTAMVTTADVIQSNGVIHVVDRVLMP